MAYYGSWPCPIFRRLIATRGCRRGLYAKVTQPVITPAGAKRALVYLGANEGPGRALPDYLAEIVAAARVWRLPAEAIAALESLRR